MIELQLDERVATLEAQVKVISKQESKIDKMMELLNEVKFSIAGFRSEITDKFMQKTDCTSRCAGCDSKFKKIESGQKKVFWAAVSATISFIVFLIQQLLRIQISVG